MRPSSTGGRGHPVIPVVHAVTTDEVVLRPDFVDAAGEVMHALGGRGALHLRAGGLAAARLQTLAEGLRVAQEVTGCWLVVNDRVDVALLAGARGAQLTSRSLSVRDARGIAPALALGASVHEVAEGVDAEAAGADWLVAGHVFHTGSHAGAAPRGVGWLAELARRVALPVVAIGGVRPADVYRLRRAGAYGVAVIRGIWNEPNAERAVRDYLSEYDDTGST